MSTMFVDVIWSREKSRRKVERMTDWINRERRGSPSESRMSLKYRTTSFVQRSAAFVTSSQSWVGASGEWNEFADLWAGYGRIIFGSTSW